MEYHFNEEEDYVISSSGNPARTLQELIAGRREGHQEFEGFEFELEKHAALEEEEPLVTTLMIGDRKMRPRPTFSASLNSYNNRQLLKTGFSSCQSI